MTSTATKKPYILVDGYPCVISVSYVTSGGGWYASQLVDTYTDLRELNKDMPEILLNLPSKHWTIAIDFQDYISPEEEDAYNT